MQNPYFGSKIKIPKNMSKSILQIIYSCSLQKTAPKNPKYSRNDSIVKIGHHACKGYSPCKILTLAQKLKFQKICQNPFYKSFTVVLCKKPRQKTPNIREVRRFQNRPSCKGYSPCKILTLAQKLKFQTTCQNPFYKSFTVVLCKKPLQKTPNIREVRRFQNRPSCKGYSPCKILTLAQKLKFQKPCQNPFYKSFTVVLCKKPLQKTPNIREMRAFSKSAIMHAKAIAHAKSSLWLKK